MTTQPQNKTPIKTRHTGGSFYCDLNPPTVIMFFVALWLCLAASCATAPLDRTPATPTPNGFDVARGVKVIDADTITVEFVSDPGKFHRVRYLNVDGPELGECYGLTAAAVNRELLQVGVVYLETPDFGPLRDRYDRLLRHVWIQQAGHLALVNFELISLGAATVWFVDDPKHIDLYRQAETTARNHDRGLHRECR